jgi:hypothetical protein
MKHEGTHTKLGLENHERHGNGLAYPIALMIHNKEWLAGEFIGMEID